MILNIILFTLAYLLYLDIFLIFFNIYFARFDNRTVNTNLRLLNSADKLSKFITIAFIVCGFLIYRVTTGLYVIAIVAAIMWFVVSQLIRMANFVFTYDGEDEGIRTICGGVLPDGDGLIVHMLIPKKYYKIQ